MVDRFLCNLYRIQTNNCIYTEAHLSKGQPREYYTLACWRMFCRCLFIFNPYGRFNNISTTLNNKHVCISSLEAIKLPRESGSETVNRKPPPQYVTLTCITYPLFLSSSQSSSPCKKWAFRLSKLKFFINQSHFQQRGATIWPVVRMLPFASIPPNQQAVDRQS